MNDKEGRKWLLQKLYDNGIKYIAFSKFYKGYVGLKNKPLFMKTGDGEPINMVGCVITLGDILPDFNEPNYLDIGKYLGIIDWSKIPVDAPIIVDLGNGTKLKRHFSNYDGCNICYFKKGKTSWTFDGIASALKSRVSLAGGYNEN